jgi:hypothetical protein
VDGKGLSKDLKNGAGRATSSTTVVDNLPPAVDMGKKVYDSSGTFALCPMDRQ